MPPRPGPRSRSGPEERRAGRYEARVNQSAGGRPRLAAKAWTCSGLRRQPPGQSNSTSLPSTQPTAAARRQLGQSSQVTRSLASIRGASRSRPAAGDGKGPGRVVRAGGPLSSGHHLARCACGKRAVDGRLVPVRLRSGPAASPPTRRPDRCRPVLAAVATALDGGRGGGPSGGGGPLPRVISGWFPRCDRAMDPLTAGARRCARGGRRCP